MVIKMSEKQKSNIDRVHVTLSQENKKKLDRMVEMGEARDVSDAVNITIRCYGGSREVDDSGLRPL